VTRAAAVLGRTNALGWLFVALLAVLLELWVNASDLGDSVSAPSDTLQALADGLTSGELSGEIGTTLWRWAQGLTIAIVLGVGVGVLIGTSRMLLAAATGVIEFLRPIPAVAFIPLAMLALGSGTPMVRFVVAYAALWPILVSTLYGVRGVDRMLLDVAQTSGLTRTATLVRVTLPAAAPGIATGIRIGAPIALVVAITAEWVATNGGIGTYMREQAALELPSMYAAVVLVAFIGYLLNVVLRAAQRRAVFWVGEERLTQ
jgi:NitT/TauT family transport system permease protein